MASKASTNIDDLYKVPDNAKAEIVDGQILLMPPTEAEPGYAGDEIFVSLRDRSRSTKTGRAIGDNKAFLVRLPNRESFSPDAAFYTGANPGMKFYEGAPVFAVEVRSDGDYGPKAEERIRQKRIDYFQAGTLVVWDVDLKSPDVIRSYNSNDPDTPTIYRRGMLPGLNSPYRVGKSSLMTCSKRIEPKDRPDSTRHQSTELCPDFRSARLCVLRERHGLTCLL